jgi:hypothetical protein
MFLFWVDGGVSYNKNSTPKDVLFCCKFDYCELSNSLFGFGIEDMNGIHVERDM